jgi:spermidine synthase
LKKLLPAFLVGFVATSFQVYLLREFSVHFYGNEMTYGLGLGGWLLWGGLGSIVASRRKIPPSRFVPGLLAVAALFPVGLAALRLSRFPLHLLPGEITGLALMLPFALGLSLLVSFPLGALFVLAVRLGDGDLSRTWIWECLGAAAGGLVVSLGLTPHLSNWQGVALVGAAAAAAAVLIPGGKRTTAGLALVLPVLAAFWILDFPTQKLFWRPFELEASRDTPYGKLQVIRLREQVSLYSNGLPVFSSGETAAAEDSIHFAFLQAPDARRALLIGGGAGGGLAEALKYPRVRIDYVELDPEIFRLSLAYLPPADRAAFENDRVRVYARDGRSFLRASRDTYDLIVLALPEPANAQVNRFYTREFFELARSRLSAAGVLSFKLSSVENYISPERGRFLATIFKTLRTAFPNVEVVPGATNVFLASRAGLTLDAETLSARVESLGLRTLYVRREFLSGRLDPLKREFLRRALESGPAGLNTDRSPVSYFFDSILWNSQFRSIEPRLLIFLSRVPAVWLLGAPLLIILLALLLLPAKRPAFTLTPLLFLGFTQIVAELVVLIWFETLYGLVYGRLALLLAAFMAGLFAGASLSRRLSSLRSSRPLVIQAGITFWVGALGLLLQTRPPQVFFYLFLLSLGFLGGHQFIVTNRIFLKRRADYGLGYGLDLLGSFVGAVTASSIFIPLAGLTGLAVFLFCVNGLSLASIALRRGG